MRIPTRRRDDPMQENVGMTSMIDVVFLLLIFFVCAAVGQVHELLLPAALESGATAAANVELPPQERLLEDVWLKLSVNEQGRTVTTLQERVYDDEAALLGTLKALVEVAPEIPVILDPQANVPAGDVIRVYDLATAAGFESLHFATDPPKTSPEKPLK